MLVLTRKPGEQIVIDNNIRITVVSLGNGRVKIGVEAPSDVKVDRQEIFDRKQNEEESDHPIIFQEERTHAPRVAAPQLENRLKALERRLPRKPR